ncbi:MAG: metal-dependent hydrolase [Panacagrimonas sp.]
MRQIAEHPMDGFPVRQLKFDMDKVGDHNLVWSRTCPKFSVFLNAFGLHVPYFEKYLLKSMRAAKPHIDDEGMKRDISAIIGQEAHHARNFIEFNQALAHKYPELGRHDVEAREYFETMAKKHNLKQMVGFTAGYETFTFLAGMIILQNHDRWFKEADPVIKGLWVWHQVEEIEHGAVAFEVYQKLFGKHEWYRKWMVVRAAIHMAHQTIKSYTPMARREGWLRNPFRAISRMSYCFWMLGRLAYAALPVLRKDYHPRKHPIATSAQNPIQIAWRRYEGQGGDVLEIDHVKMAQIMRVPTQAA